MKNLLNFKRLCTDSHEKQSPQRLVRYAAILIILLTLGVGQMWAENKNNFYLVGDPSEDGWTKNDYDILNYKDGDNKRSICYFVSKNQCFAMHNGSSQYGPSTNNNSMYPGKTGEKPDQYYTSNAWQYTGNTGIIKFCINEETAWYPYVWVERPTVVIKHDFTSGGDWEQENMTDNQDGTYYYIGTYNGTGVNVGPSICLKYIATPTINNGGSSISNGTRCFFDFNASDFRGGSRGEAYNTGSVTITKAVTVSFNLKGHGSAIDAQEIRWNTTASTPSDPSATGYTFGGWYTNSECTTSYNFSTAVTADIELFAKWTPKTTALTLAKNDGTGTTTSTTATYDATISVTPPSRTGYNFTGYYTAGGSKIIDTDGHFVSSAVDGFVGSGQIWISTESSLTLTAQWTAKTYTITLDDNGTYQDNGSATATYDGLLDVITHASRTGYDIEGYYKEAECTNKIANADGSLCASTDYTDESSHWTNDGAVSLYAKWTAHTYNVTLNAGTGGSGSGTMTVDYDATAFTTFSHDIEKTGYTISGWYTAASAGTKVLNADGSFAGENVSDYITTNKWNKAANCTLHAHWTANNYTVTLDIDEPNHGTIDGKDTEASVTFDAAPTNIAAGKLPTAANGYAFMGFRTAANGGGVQVINDDGTWIASVADYTDESTHWIHDGNVTLYAYYKKAVITAITFDGGTSAFAPSATATVTATIAPTPTDPTIVCWKVLYSNDNEYTGITFTPEDGARVSFTVPEASGTYKIQATLRTGSSCGGGEVLSTTTVNFQVAGDHNVTVQYKCGDEFIAASTTVTGKPLEWTEVVAHEIFGYTFSSWTAGDGITLRDTTADRLAELQAIDRTIVAVKRMKAIYDGRLTANYTKKDFIYFKSTKLGWNDVYVYFYTDGGYWDSNLGAGATGAACIGKGKMDLVPGETDIYYWDYGAHITGGASAATKYVAFTWGDCTNHTNFNGIASCYPMNGNNQGFSSGTPMFVPISQSENYRKHNNATPYFDRGYWTRYTGGTGYSVDIFYANESYDKSINFEEGESEGMPYTATVYLNGGSNLYFKVHRSSDIYYYSTTNVTMSDAATKSLTYDSEATNKTTITTNVAGDYIFTLTCADNGALNVTVKYPAAAGDYRLVYSDAVQIKPLVSDVVPQVNGGKDTVSFFVRQTRTPVLKIQRASVSAGVLSWNDYSTVSSDLTAARCPKDSVYNICLRMNESGEISVENVVAYTGEFYIRTDAANNKWDNYRSADHMMTYSEYSDTHSDYTHYWMAHVENNTNVKFVVANDYSPCISDTLIQQAGDTSVEPDHVNASGDIQAEANIRFMWDRSTNTVQRAYLAPAKENGSKFLVLRGQPEKLLSEAGTELDGYDKDNPGNNHGGGLNCMQFSDDENWIYETTVQVVPNSYVKLYAHFHESNFYYRGIDNDDFNGTLVDKTPNAIQLVTGSSEAAAVIMRVVYDFKTDRLLAAMLPSGVKNVAEAINADVMFIREHQQDIQQLSFSASGALTDIKSAYGVMRFNKYTLNNKSTATGHAPLVSPASVYERSLYWISFPFRVKLSEVFGFGRYGVDWAIQQYDGAARAAEGFWLESSGFWEWMDRNTGVLEPNQGYLLAIDLDLLGEESSVWDNDVERIELFFPSYGKMPDITGDNVVQELPTHACGIDRSGESNGRGGTLGPAYNRTIIDSHWNVMSVPTYVNTDDITFANTEWINGSNGILGPNFLYTWNASDNTLTPTAGQGYTYHAMHAYMVQYCGNVTWSAASGSPYPSPIVARRTYAEKPQKVNFCLEIQQNEQMLDRTYVQLSNDEETSSNFAFGEDMGKEFNSRNANIYTVIENYLPAAGNTLPMSEQTTVVPVGVKVNAAGEYTFAMPEGTEGIGVVLIDNIAGTRTNLGLMDYTVTLSQGKIDGRFALEISPVAQTPTDIDNVQGDNVPGAKARKVMIDGILYIVKDGKVFDARGGRVE